jgi:methylisocitrate lyase
MLFSEADGAGRRQRLARALESGKLLRMPGAFSPLVARIVEDQGWDGVYLSGAALAADLGLPDVGVTTLSEVAGRARQIAGSTRLPCIADADTGFGEPINAARCVRELEDAGVAGCHLEDQVLPKRCGHLDSKTLCDTAVMVQRIGAAVRARRDDRFLLIARTDARAAEGLSGAIRRAQAYVDAGAGAVFPEALESEQELAAFRAAIDVPLIANMTEFGRTPLLSADRLEELGYDVVIYPVTSLRLAMGAVEQGLRHLREGGSQRELTARMQTRERLYELLRYDEYSAFDQQVAKEDRS